MKRIELQNRGWSLTLAGAWAERQGRSVSQPSNGVAEGYPGCRGPEFINPNGVVSRHGVLGPQPRWGCGFGIRFPKVGADARTCLAPQPGARDLSRRNLRTAQTRPPNSKASFAHQRPCGLKSALLRSRGDHAKHILTRQPWAVGRNALGVLLRCQGLPRMPRRVRINMSFSSHSHTV